MPPVPRVMTLKDLPSFTVDLPNGRTLTVEASRFEPGSPSVGLGPELDIREAYWEDMSIADVGDLINDEVAYNLLLEAAEQVYGQQLDLAINQGIP